jgi:hypothetical protein
MDFLIRRRRIEIKEGFDISAHALLPFIVFPPLTGVASYQN